MVTICPGIQFSGILSLIVPVIVTVSPTAAVSMASTVTTIGAYTSKVVVAFDGR